MAHQETSSDVQHLLPVSESTFMILVSLGGEPKHGYAIMKEVEALSQGRVILSTGTLYGAIKRLLGDEWIYRAEMPEEGNDGRNRKFYALTKRGRRVLDAETKRLQELVAIAGRRLVPGGERGGD